VVAGGYKPCCMKMRRRYRLRVNDLCKTNEIGANQLKPIEIFEVGDRNRPGQNDDDHSGEHLVNQAPLKKQLWVSVADEFVVPFECTA
jgi:hypothetical protein